MYTRFASMPRPVIALVAALAGGGNVSPATADEPELLLERSVEHLAVPAREPMVVVHPSGDLFLAGYWRYQDPESVPLLWRGRDGGRTWTAVDVGKVGDGARGNSDVDLAVGPEGTLYFVTMGFDRQSATGTHIAVAASSDNGASWRWVELSADRGSDRPWVGVVPDGTAHVIWNDGRGVRHAVSRDRGVQWEEQDRIADAGGSSHFAIGPGGELAVRLAPVSAAYNRFDAGIDRIAVSLDAGESWQVHDAPGERYWRPTPGEARGVPRWVEPLAFDDQGALYSFWSTGQGLVLARSRDGAASWEQWPVISGSTDVFYPYLAARGDGELAASWFSGQGDSLAVNVAYLQVPDTNGEELKVWRAPSFQQDAWSGAPGAAARDTAGEYLPVLFLDRDHLGIAEVIQRARRVAPGVERLVGDRQGFAFRRYRLPVN
jgi:hypothetical protein